MMVVIGVVTVVLVIAGLCPYSFFTVVVVGRHSYNHWPSLIKIVFVVVIDVVDIVNVVFVVVIHTIELLGVPLMVA